MISVEVHQRTSGNEDISFDLELIGRANGLIPLGSDWKFNDADVDLGDSNQESAGSWRDLAYDDSFWGEGPAQLGFGDGDESTVIDKDDARETTYFRHRFDVADPSAYTNLRLDLLLDDGAIVYLNGTEIGRENLTSGTVTHETTATGNVSNALTVIENIDTDLLVSGTNILAVEVHENSAASWDMSFDLALTASRADYDRDALDFSNFGSAIVLNLTASEALNHNDLTVNLKPGTLISNVTGTSKADTITGNSLDNVLIGGGMGDTLKGGAGDDILVGGRGDDSLIGESGDDTYDFTNYEFAENGDLVVFDLGTDRLDEVVTASSDTLDFSGFIGDDPVTTTEIETEGIEVDLTAAAYPTPQVVHAYLDLVFGTANTFENVYGSVGDDTIDGNSSDNLLVGNYGNDEITGGAGDDTLMGELTGELWQSVDFNLPGDLIEIDFVDEDTLRGDAGDDWLDGGSGDDRYLFDRTGVGDSLGDDTIDESFGWGSDTLDFSGFTVAADEGLEFDLSVADETEQTIGDDADELTVKLMSSGAIENIIGSLYGDTLTGNDADNSLYGGDGDDTLIGGDGDDQLTGGKGDDQLTGGDGDDTYLFSRASVGDSLGDDTITESNTATSGNDTLDFSGFLAESITVDLTGDDQGSVADDLSLDLSAGANFENLIGGAGDDVFTGNGSDNRLEGGEGDDSLIGGKGDDTYVFRRDDTIINLGEDTVTGDSDPTDGSADTLDFTNFLVDTTTSDGIRIDLKDSLVQTVHADLDLKIVNASNVDIVIGSRGDDTLLGSTGEDLLIGNLGNDTLRGAEGDDKLYGGDLYGFAFDPFFDEEVYNADDDLLEGGKGHDLLVGGAGDDTYDFSRSSNTIDLGKDTVDEFAGGGEADKLDFSDFKEGVTVNLGLDTEQTVVTSEFQLIITELDTVEMVTGSDFGDTLTSGASGSWLAGGKGDDLLIGGAGDDVYVFSRDDTTVDLGDDTVQEDSSANAGIDTLDFSGYREGVNVDLGSVGEEVIEGTFKLKLVGGDDKFENVIGGVEADTITGNSVGNRLIGGGGNDIIDGKDGNDVLEGGLGDDSLLGGNGDDTYLFARDDTTADLGSDTLNETSTDGTDVVDFSNFMIDGTTGISFDLSDDDLQTVFGVALDEKIQIDLADSGDFENAIGTLADDTLQGNTGANMLDGGAGDDLLIGGIGNDTYVTGTSSESGADTITEATGAGTDTLDFSAFGWGVDFDLKVTTQQTIVQDISNVIVSNVENVTGSEYDDTITGDTGANVISGRGGNDLLAGGAGNDTLYGGDGDDRLAGEAGNDLLDGGDGLDRLAGGAGNDELTGGSSSDTFVFDRDDTTASLGTDTINEDDLPEETLIEKGANWLYLDDGSNQDATSWNELVYDDSNWLSGAAALGYGETPVTSVSYGPDENAKHITTYFRHEFEVADASKFVDLTVKLMRDDGAVVYLNGVEVVSDNMPGSVTYTTLASSAISGSDETDFNNSVIDADLLVEGTNVIAVEIHQHDDSTSDDDISFDLELVGVRSADADLLDFSQFGDPIEIDLSDDTNVQIVEKGETELRIKLNNKTGIENVIGTEGNDTILGNDADNDLRGEAGNDILKGKDGNDAVYGGEGDDTVYGDAGNDSLDGSSGDDVLGNPASQNAEAGDDIIWGGTGHDELNGGAGEDVLIGGTGDDTLQGGDDNDYLDATSGDDELQGGEGDDELVSGSFGDVTLIGDAGDDTYGFRQGHAPDASTVRVEESNASGKDRLDFSRFSAAVTVSLNDSTSQEAAHSLELTLNIASNFEDVTGSSGDDWIVGNAQGNQLAGGPGNDTLFGADGNDTLTGGDGDDTYAFDRDSVSDSLGQDTIVESDGMKSGSDWLDFSHFKSAVNIDLSIDTLQVIITNKLDLTLGNAEIENVVGSPFDDTLYGNGGNNIFEGSFGNDTLNGGMGDDTYLFARGSTSDDLGEDSVTDVGISGQWLLDEGNGSTAEDTAQFENNGTIEGNPVWSTNGPIGLNGSLTFDGSGDAINMGQPDELNFDPDDDEFTLAAWIKVESGDNGTIVSKAGGLMADRQYQFFVSNGKLGAIVGGVSVFDDATTVTNGMWHHVAMVNFDDNGTHKFKFYVDGVPTGPTTASGSKTQTLDVLIGARRNNDNADFGFQFEGDLAGVQILDGAVSADALLSVYENGGVLANGGDTLDFSNYLADVDVSINTETQQTVEGDFKLTLSNAKQLENIIGGDFDDVLTGNALDNVLDGNAGVDILTGGDGNDTLIGGEGNDTLRGQNGDDTFVFARISDEDLGDDTISGTGDAGNDTFDLTLLGVGASVDLTSSTPIDITDVLKVTVPVALPIENVIGTSGDDTITGNTDANVLSGGGGNDVINGGSGADVIDGGTGNDTINGEAGDDVYLFPRDEDVNLGVDVLIAAAGAGTDTIDFSQFNETVAIDLAILGYQQSVFDGVLALQLIADGDGFENIIGSPQDDVLKGNDAANTIWGGGGNDVLEGRDGNDLLYGEAGDDTLIGGANDDTLTGGAGGDTLIGGANDDTLAGGAGGDTYAFARGNTSVDLGEDSLDEVGAAGQWLLHDGSGSSTVKDTSLKGNDGTILGDPVWTSGPDGQADEALTFDGSGDAIRMGQPEDLSFDTDVDEFTLAAWIKTSSDNAVILSKGAGAIWGERQYQLDVYQDQLRAIVGGVQVSSGTTVNDGKWHHVAVVNYKDVADDNKLKFKLYVDGDQKGTIKEAGDAGQQTLDFLIGARHDANENLAWEFSGDISGVQVFDRVVSDTALQSAFEKKGGVVQEGVDTLDFSGYLAGVTVDLSDESEQDVDQTFKLTLGSDIVFENVIGSNSDDVLTGNALNNVLEGGEGDDRLAGGLGDDRYVFSQDDSLQDLGNDSLEEDVDSTDLVSHWNFNDENDPANDVKGSINGTLSGADWTVGDDLFGNGVISLDGTDDYVDLNSNDVLPDTFTISGWFNVDPDVSSGWKEIFWQQYTHVYYHNGELKARLTIGSGNGVTVGVPDVEVGVWNHFAFTYDGAEVKLYLNGVGSAPVAKTGTPWSGTNAYIGKSQNDTNYFHGQLDEIKIYDRALAADEVAQAVDPGKNTLDFSGYLAGVTVDLSDESEQVIDSVTDFRITLGSDIAFSDVIGSDFNDELTGNTLDNQLTGGLGNDTLHGGDGDDTLNGGDGVDDLYGDAGDDTLHGGDGDDNLDGGVDNDTLYGDAGSNTIEGGAGYNIFSYDSGAIGQSIYGTDTISNSSESGSLNFTDYGYSVTINLGDELGKQTQGDGNLIIILTSDSALRNVWGSAYNDEITGNDFGNYLYGRNGDDKIWGGNGDDTLYGGDGDDILDGGNDDDHLNGGEGDDWLFGYNGDDHIDGGGGIDVGTGGDGDDTHVDVDVWHE